LLLGQDEELSTGEGAFLWKSKPSLAAVQLETELEGSGGEGGVVTASSDGVPSMVSLSENGEIAEEEWMRGRRERGCVGVGSSAPPIPLRRLSGGGC